VYQDGFVVAPQLQLLRYLAPQSLLNVILHDQLPEQNAASVSLLEDSNRENQADLAKKLQL
jgi:hypothetical protein